MLQNTRDDGLRAGHRAGRHEDRFLGLFEILEGLVGERRANGEKLQGRPAAPDIFKLGKVMFNALGADQLIPDPGNGSVPDSQSVKLGDMEQIVERDDPDAPRIFWTTMEGLPGMCLGIYLATTREKVSVPPPGG